MRPFLLVLCVALGSLACEDDNSPEPRDMSGAFSFTESFSDAGTLFSCSDTGTLNLSQEGNVFAGTYTQQGQCLERDSPADTIPAPVDFSGTNPVDGRINGIDAIFVITRGSSPDVPGCRYTGISSGDPVSFASGSVTCTVLRNSRTLQLNGNWQARR